MSDSFLLSQGINEQITPASETTAQELKLVNMLRQSLAEAVKCVEDDDDDGDWTLTD